MRRVTQVHVRPIEKINTFYKLTVSKDGAEEDFYVTGEHPFWIADKAEWRSVDELSVGDALADFGGHRLRVSAKAPVSEKQQTYNISVEGNATYFAGRSEVLVHNNNCGNLPVGYAINADGTVTTPAPGEALLGLRAQVPAGYPDPTLIPGYAVLERLTPSGSPTGQFLTFTSNAAGDALVQFPVTQAKYPDLGWSAAAVPFDLSAQATLATDVPLTHVPTSGATLTVTPGLTTTVVGAFGPDLQFILPELGVPVQSGNLADVVNSFSKGNPGGLNFLNVDDATYLAGKAAGGFFTTVNGPWVDAAIARGDQVTVASDRQYTYVIDPVTGDRQLTGFGKENEQFQANGYSLSIDNTKLVPPTK